MELSSDLLKAEFGPTEFAILYADPATNQRIVSTKQAGNGKLLELSWVKFNAQGIKEYPEIHQTIVNGGSMGESFVNADVKVSRNFHGAYTCDLPDGLHERFGAKLATAVFSIFEVGPEHTPYAELLEVFTVDSKRLAKWISDPQAKPDTSQQAQINDFANLLRSN